MVKHGKKKAPILLFKNEKKTDKFSLSVGKVKVIYQHIWYISRSKVQIGQ